MYRPIRPFSRASRLLIALAACTSALACGGDTAPSPDLAAPTLASPSDDAIAGSPPVLTINNVAASAAGAATYDFQVADSQGALTGPGTGLIASSSVPEGSGGRTSYTVDRTLQSGRRYYWRARIVRAGTPGTWSSVFRFRTDFAPNARPVIQSLTRSSERAEVDGEVEVTALVQDQETSAASLVYEWTATGGSFTGTGSTVRWRAPAVAAPTQHTLTVTVIERYTVTDPDGRSETRENRVTETTTVRVNDSQAELRNLALTFLDDFVHSERSAAVCVRNFTDSCPGKQWEFEDITRDRANYVIDPARSSFSIASINFNRAPGSATRATILAPCSFGSTRISTGVFGVSSGTCRLIAVYEAWRWFLCESWFDGDGSIAPFRIFDLRRRLPEE